MLQCMYSGFYSMKLLASFKQSILQHYKRQTLPIIPMTFKSASVRSLNFCRSSDLHKSLACDGEESCNNIIIIIIVN